MKRAVRKSILRAARAAGRRRHGWGYDLTVTLDVPPAFTAGAPVWAPPGCTEIATAWAWARADVPGLFHAVVTTWPAEGGDSQVLSSGLVTPEHLLGLGGLCDKPHRIRQMAVPGTLDAPHPAAVYQSWVERAGEDARAVLFPETGHSSALYPIDDDVAFEHCLNGSWRVVIGLWLDDEPGLLHDDADLAADRVTALARRYGPGTRVRVYPWGSRQLPYEVIEPAYAAAVVAFWKPREKTDGARTAEPDASTAATAQGAQGNQRRRAPAAQHVHQSRPGAAR